MTRQQLQEEIVKLFLRLNGYFTTGLIIHSATQGRNQTELDVIAIRLPFHNQPDRIVPTCADLQIPADTIDIIIGEVKSRKEELQFNLALRQSTEAIEKLLRWIGAADIDAEPAIVNQVQTLMATAQLNESTRFQSLAVRTQVGNYTIRPIIFSMDRPAPRRNQVRFVHGQLMLNYIWECLRPDNIRPTCATNYDLNLWGYSAHPLITYFKDASKTVVGNMNDLYTHFTV